MPVMNVNGYRLADGTWYPQSEQPENDLLNDYHNAEYAQILMQKIAAMNGIHRNYAQNALHDTGFSCKKDTVLRIFLLFLIKF